MSNKPTENQDTCENLRNKEGETFKGWWATQIAKPSRNGIGQTWTKADHEMLWVILNAYASSAKAASWGCLCSGETQTETCDQQTPRNSDANNDDATKVTCWIQHDAKGAGSVSCAQKAAEAHNTRREKALDMVSDRVARNHGIKDSTSQRPKKMKPKE